MLLAQVLGKDSVPGLFQPRVAFLGLWLLPHLQSQQQSIFNLSLGLSPSASIVTL